LISLLVITTHRTCKHDDHPGTLLHVPQSAR
jgi:hypothetical protein